MRWPPTRNQRLAALRTFFAYVASQVPEMLEVSQQVMTVPVKRAAAPETCFLHREEITALFRRLPLNGRHALRDQTLLCTRSAEHMCVPNIVIGHIIMTIPVSLYR